MMPFFSAAGQCDLPLRGVTDGSLKIRGLQNVRCKPTFETMTVELPSCVLINFFFNAYISNFDSLSVS